MFICAGPPKVLSRREGGGHLQTHIPREKKKTEENRRESRGWEMTDKVRSTKVLVGKKNKNCSLPHTGDKGEKK